MHTILMTKYMKLDVNTTFLLSPCLLPHTATLAKLNVGLSMVSTPAGQDINYSELRPNIKSFHNRESSLIKYAKNDYEAQIVPTRK